MMSEKTQALVKKLSKVLEGEPMGDMADALGILIAFYAWSINDRCPDALRGILLSVQGTAFETYAIAEKETASVN